MYNNYEKQAFVWDWDAFDDTPEYEYWRSYAERFGQNVLVPMCALGQSAAYLAEHGFSVTAFDITPEMISEGKARFGAVGGLELIVGDILSLDLETKNYDFTFLAGHGDLHLLQTLGDVRQAFHSLHRRLRAGGCLALELSLPAPESFCYPKREYQPRVPRYTDKKVWKVNEGRYDAAEKRNYIEQTVHVESAADAEAFTQRVCLQYYERGEILALLKQCGFSVQGEFSDRARMPWTPGQCEWLVEAVKIG
ncbi:MAG: class I SAM-dependent methyltransferase [Oscillospiraceae bacterium]|nr:class I SAM-dependent methyltransferase [Oscillospiraceae bacterium]